MNYEDIELEHHITMTRVQKHGYVDALFGDLLIEFKRNIKTDLGSNVDQLRDYMRDMPELHRYIGMLTDGVNFRTYVLDDAEEAKEVDSFTITESRRRCRISYGWIRIFSADKILNRPPMTSCSALVSGAPPSNSSSKRSVDY